MFHFLKKKVDLLLSRLFLHNRLENQVLDTYCGHLKVQEISKKIQKTSKDLISFLFKCYVSQKCAYKIWSPNPTRSIFGSMKYARGRCRFGHHGTEQHGTEQQKRAKGLRLRDQDLRPQNSRTKVFGFFRQLSNFRPLSQSGIHVCNFSENRQLSWKTQIIATLSLPCPLALI